MRIIDNIMDFSKIDGIIIEDNSIIVTNDISKENLLYFLENLFNIESKFHNIADKNLFETKERVFVNMSVSEEREENIKKGNIEKRVEEKANELELKILPDDITDVELYLNQLNIDLLSEAIKYSLKRDDLRDPLMILNIMNLIKTSSTFDDNYFDDKRIYVNSLDDLIDLQYEIEEEINSFIKRISVYFISLIKYFNKVVYTPIDKKEELPSLYKTIMLSLDFLTLSGILSISEGFDIDECPCIVNAAGYMSVILSKSIVGTSLMSSLLERKEQIVKEKMSCQ